MVDKLRQLVEWQVLELIKKLTEIGKMTEEASQNMAKHTLEVLQPGMTLEQFFKNIGKLDDGFSELSFIVLPLEQKYQEKIENPSVDFIRSLVKNAHYDEAISLAQKIVNQDVKIKLIASGKVKQLSS